MGRKKVIKGLEACIENDCENCVYDTEICQIDKMLSDALALLKKQEIVRCKDCKYLIDHYGFMDDGYCRNMRNEHNIKFKPDKDWFCADGERRGSE